MKPLTALLLVIAALVVASLACGSSSSSSRTPTPTPKTAWLYCPDCADVEMKINLWQNGGSDRGTVVGKAAHADEVFVLESKKDSSEGRYYYRVKVKETGATGWVPEALIAIP